MDKLERYSQLIKKILQEEAQYKPSHGEIEPLLLFDDEHRNYQLLYAGWDRKRRVFGSIYHLRIHNQKIYIEEDTSNTDCRKPVGSRRPQRRYCAGLSHTRKAAVYGFRCRLRRGGVRTGQSNKKREI